MSLHRTDYGLLYTDDGSLCTTIRTDDVPFPGVKSFAVEEGTENLIDFSQIRQSAGTSCILWNCTKNYFTFTNLGNYTYKLTKDNSEAGAAGIVFAADNITENTSYTASANLEWSGGAGKRGLYIRFYDSDNNIINENPNDYNESLYDDSWQIDISGRYTSTFTAPAGTVRAEFYIGLGSGDTQAGEWVIVKWFQLEKKPFATSFVDGTRPDGGIILPIALQDKLVISGWFNPRGSSANSNSGGWARLIDFEEGADTKRVMFGYYKAQGTSVSNHFGLNVKNGTTEVTKYFFNSCPFNAWCYYVFVIDNPLKAYVFDTNGNFEIITNPADWSDITSTELRIGARNGGTTDTLNGLISNLLIAPYDPTIWTDNYIRQLYHTRVPFLEPKKEWLA
jgi:hypothetical protein